MQKMVKLRERKYIPRCQAEYPAHCEGVKMNDDASVVAVHAQRPKATLLPAMSVLRLGSYRSLCKSIEVTMIISWEDFT